MKVIIIGYDVITASMLTIRMRFFFIPKTLITDNVTMITVTSMQIMF